jgi:hypothetical protein
MSRWKPTVGPHVCHVFPAAPPRFAKDFSKIIASEDNLDNELNEVQEHKELKVQGK